MNGKLAGCHLSLEKDGRIPLAFILCKLNVLGRGEKARQKAKKYG
jgi:hypothetical protein